MKRVAIAVLMAWVATAVLAYAGEGAGVAAVIRDASRAMSELPTTHDRRSVLKHYTADFRSLTDGEWQTLDNLRSVVAEIEENVRLGNPVKIENRPENIRAEAASNLGWAVYDFYSKIEVLGEVLGEVKRICTGIYRKTSDTWQIRHEHCSTTWAAQPPTEEDLEDSPEEEPLEG